MGNGEILPQKYKPMNDSKKRFMKPEDGWQYILWNEEMIMELLQIHYSWFVPYYITYKNRICQADAVRYFILHKYGGIYMDQDLTIYKNIEPLLENHDAVFVHECTKCSKGLLDVHKLNGKPYYDNGITMSNNYFMASIPGHSVFETLQNKLIETHKSRHHVKNSYNSVLRTTGPTFLMNGLKCHFNEHGNKPQSIYILPQLALSNSGVSPSVKEKLEIKYSHNEQETREWFYANHDYVGSWIVPSEKQSLIYLALIPVTTLIIVLMTGIIISIKK